MAEVVLFHHARGLTPGISAFADELRRAGHTVHTPDLFEGRTFATLEEGVGHVEEIGFGEVIERGIRAVEGLPAELVYAGFSLGVLPAQRLAQTRSGARGALLFHACVPVSLFLYAGDRHLFADRSLPSYDAEASAVLIQRVLDFLGAPER
jgi:dienelactone hydrolase